MVTVPEGFVSSRVTGTRRVPRAIGRAAARRPGQVECEKPGEKILAREVCGPAVSIQDRDVAEPLRAVASADRGEVAREGAAPLKPSDHISGPSKRRFASGPPPGLRLRTSWPERTRSGSRTDRVSSRPLRLKRQECIVVKYVFSAPRLAGSLKRDHAFQQQEGGLSCPVHSSPKWPSPGPLPTK